MATMNEVRLAVHAARRLRPQTGRLHDDVVDASGDGWDVEFAYDDAESRFVATVTTTVRLEAGDEAGA